MRKLKLSEATESRRELFVTLLSDVDGVTPVTGAAPTAQIVKAGGAALTALVGSVVEIGSGVYKVLFAVGDIDTLGEGKVVVSAANAITVYRSIDVVAFDPYSAVNLGLSRIDENVSAAKTLTSVYDAAKGAAQSSVLADVVDDLSAIGGKVDAIQLTEVAIDGKIDDVVDDLSAVGTKVDTIQLAEVSIEGKIDIVQAKTDQLAFVEGKVSASADIGSLSTQAKAEVNAELVDVLSVDTHAELSAAPSAATPTILQMLRWVYTLCRNKVISTSSVSRVYKADGSTQLGEKTVSDNGTQFTSGSW